MLVVGAGRAGVAAANAAAAACGATVLLVESDERLDRCVSESIGSAVDCRFGTTCVGIYADLWAALVDARRLTKVRARSLVLASGCEDQPAVFGNNDLPGVMLGQAARRLMERYAVRPADRPLVFTAGDDGCRLAEAMRERGMSVAAVVDLREGALRGGTSGDAEPAGVPVYRAHAVVEALPARGHSGVGAARIRALDARRGGRWVRGGRFPATASSCASVVPRRDGLLRQAGGVMAYDPVLHRHVPDALPDGVFAAGSVAGVDGEAAADGRAAPAGRRRLT